MLQTNDAIKTPSLSKTLASAAVVASASNSPTEFREFVQAEYAKWGRVVQQAGISSQ